MLLVAKYNLRSEGEHLKLGSPLWDYFVLILFIWLFLWEWVWKVKYLHTKVNLMNSHKKIHNTNFKTFKTHRYSLHSWTSPRLESLLQLCRWDFLQCIMHMTVSIVIIQVTLSFTTMYVTVSSLADTLFS